MTITVALVANALVNSMGMMFTSNKTKLAHMFGVNDAQTAQWINDFRSLSTSPYEFAYFLVGDWSQRNTQAATIGALQMLLNAEEFRAAAESVSELGGAFERITSVVQVGGALANPQDVADAPPMYLRGQCIICANNTVDRRLPCGHCFCEECLIRVAASNAPHCPTCRVALGPSHRWHRMYL